MQLRNTPDRWGAVHQIVHWVIAPLALLQIGFGGYIGGLLPEDIERSTAYGVHVSLGLLILLLMIVRLVWRLANPVPRMPQRLGRPERALARTTHYGFYVLLIVQPIVGYLMASARDSPLTFLGATLPAAMAPNEPLATVFAYAHLIIAALLILTVALHVAGALRHELILRDNTLRRMTPLSPREGDYRARTTERASEAEGPLARRR